MSSTSYLRSSRSATSNTPLSTTKAKRKSGDRDDMENRSPNRDEEDSVPKSAKKSRFFGSKPEEQLKKSQVASRIRSALPRYNSSSVVETKKRQVTERITAERSQTTPTRSIEVSSAIKSPRPSVAGSVKRRGRQSLSKVTRGRIKSLFDKVNLQDEEKINELIAPKLKVKCKWDYKDKAKRQTEVINDLKSVLKETIQEFKSVKTDCEDAEQSMDELINQLRLDLQDYEKKNGDLKKSESKLKKDYIRVSNDYNSCRSQFRALEEEIEPLRESVAKKDLEIEKLRNNLDSEDDLLKSYELEVSDLKDTLKVLRDENSDLTKSFQELVDEASMEYQKEVEMLKQQLNKIQIDFDRVNSEKDRIKDKAEGTTENVFKLESQLREALATVERQTLEKSKLQEDLTEMKANLTLKDSDLRATLSSMQEFQRLASDEKAALRAELSNLQPRMQLMEAQKIEDKALLASNKEELSSAAREINRLKELVDSTLSTVAQKERDIAMFRDAAVQMEVEKEVRLRAERREEMEREERIAACAQLLATQSDCASRIREAEEKSNATISDLRLQLMELERQRETDASKFQEITEKATVLEGQLCQYQSALDNAKANHETVAELGQVKAELEILRRRVAEQNDIKQHESASAQQRIIELENQIADNDAQRRKLHNLVQELRGNVRVFARVRPFLPSDEIEGSPESTIITRHDNAGIRIVRQPQKPDEKLEEHTFVFDKSFAQSSSQEAVFQEVSEFVQSSLDGFSVCIFSYGQTGSGKTHTMQGSGDGPMRGIIPRAIQQVGKYKIEQESKGWEYFMEVSFVEIYNETIRDLLRQQLDSECKHEIKKDANGNVFVSDATMIAIDPNDSNQLDEIMQLAARHRSVGHTSMNAQSSRSHSIFTLHLKARNSAEGIVLKGALNLVDLAGSERLDRSGATGARMKETLAINKSLSSLTDVFVAIANKQAHIPYRNSKLTHLLQPCLSGDGKALMMVNLSPTYESYFESLCSLRFASQVNQCELGKPKRFMKEAAGGPLACSTKSTLIGGSQTSTTSISTTSTPKSSTSMASGGVKSGIVKSSSTVGSSTPGRKIARLK